MLQVYVPRQQSRMIVRGRMSRIVPRQQSRAIDKGWLSLLEDSGAVRKRKGRWRVFPSPLPGFPSFRRLCPSFRTFDLLYFSGFPSTQVFPIYCSSRALLRPRDLDLLFSGFLPTGLKKEKKSYTRLLNILYTYKTFWKFSTRLCYKAFWKFSTRFLKILMMPSLPEG